MAGSANQLVSVTLTADTGDFARAMTVSRDQWAEWQRAATAGGAAALEAGQAAETTGKKVAGTARDLSKATDSAEDLGKGLDKAGEQAKEAGTAADKAGKQTLSASAGFSTLKKSAEDLGKGLAAAVAAYKIYDFGRDSIRSWVDYERALTGVGKVTDLTGAKLASLGEDIQALGQRPEMGATISELMDMAQAAGQLGVASPDITKFTSVIAMLQGATDLVGADGAQSLARILTLTRQTPAVVDRLASSIVALGNSYAATESEITHNSLRLAQDLSLYNVSTASIAGLGGAMAALGITAERGGGAAARAFAAIDAAVRRSGAEQQALSRITGQTAEQLKAAWGEDTAQVFIDMLGGLARIKAAGGDVAAAMAHLGLTATEDVSALGTLASGMDTVTSAVGLSTTAWRTNTDLVKEATAAGQTAANQFTVFGNRVDGLKINLGEELTPALISAGDSLAALLDNARDSGSLALFADSLGAAAQALVAPLSAAAGNMDLVATAATALIGLRVASTMSAWAGSLVQVIAQARAAGAAAGGLAALTAAGRGLVGVLGGPVGVALTAAAAGTVYLTTRQTAAEQAARSHAAAMAAAEKAIKETGRAAQTAGGQVDQLAAKQGKAAELALNNAIRNQQAARASLAKDIYNALTPVDLAWSVSAGAQAFEALSREWRAGAIDIDTLRERAISLGLAFPDWGGEAEAVVTAIDAYAKAGGELDDLNAALRRVQTAGGAPATPAAGQPATPVKPVDTGGEYGPPVTDWAPPATSKSDPWGDYVKQSKAATAAALALASAQARGTAAVAAAETAAEAEAQTLRLGAGHRAEIVRLVEAEAAAQAKLAVSTRVADLDREIAAEQRLAAAARDGAAATEAATQANKLAEEMIRLKIEAGTAEAEQLRQRIAKLAEEAKLKENNAVIGGQKDAIGALQAESDWLTKVASSRSLNRAELEKVADLTQRQIPLTSQQAQEELRLAAAQEKQSRTAQAARAAATSWSDGAGQAMADFSAAANDNAALANSAFSGVFNSWSSSLADFVTDFDFSMGSVLDLIGGFGKAVIAEAAKVLASKTVAGAIDVIGGLFSGGGSSGGSGFFGAIGGAIKSVGSWLGLAGGGPVSGPGGPTDDAIPARLSNGEYVINAAATAEHRDLVTAINDNDPARIASAAEAWFVARRGFAGDTALAHVTPREAALLTRLGGIGTVNPRTGLRQYWDGMGDGRGTRDPSSGVGGRDTAGAGTGGRDGGGENMGRSKGSVSSAAAASTTGAQRDAGLGKQVGRDVIEDRLQRASVVNKEDAYGWRDALGDVVEGFVSAVTGGLVDLEVTGNSLLGGWEAQGVKLDAVAGALNAVAPGLGGLARAGLTAAGYGSLGKVDVARVGAGTVDVGLSLGGVQGASVGFDRAAVAAAAATNGAAGSKAKAVSDALDAIADRGGDAAAAARTVADGLDQIAAVSPDLADLAAAGVAQAIAEVAAKTEAWRGKLAALSPWISETEQAVAQANETWGEVGAKVAETLASAGDEAIYAQAGARAMLTAAGEVNRAAPGLTQVQSAAAQARAEFAALAGQMVRFGVDAAAANVGLTKTLATLRAAQVAEVTDQYREAVDPTGAKVAAIKSELARRQADLAAVDGTAADYAALDLWAAQQIAAIRNGVLDGLSDAIAGLKGDDLTGKLRALAQQRAEQWAAVSAVGGDTAAVDTWYALAVATADATAAGDARTEALREEADALADAKSRWDRVAESLRALPSKLAIDQTYSPLSDAGRLAEARKQLSEAAAKAEGGDINAAEQVEELITAFLAASRDYNHSGVGYEADYKWALSLSTAVANGAQRQVDAVARQIAAIEAQTNTVVGVIRESTKALADALAKLAAERAGQTAAAGGTMGGFNSAAYLAANPDVAYGISKGQFTSAAEHYVKAGASEGRSPTGAAAGGTASINSEQAYLAANPDVAAAVKRGEFASGYAHYMAHGRGERRGYAAGGWVTGPGGPTDDAVAAWLSAGEHVTHAAAARQYPGVLEAVNNQTLRIVDPLPPQVVPVAAPAQSGGGSSEDLAPLMARLIERIDALIEATTSAASDSRRAAAGGTLAVVEELERVRDALAVDTTGLALRATARGRR